MIEEGVTIEVSVKEQKESDEEAGDWEVDEAEEVDGILDVSE